MALKRVVLIDTGNISSGSYTDVSYAPEVDLTLNKVYAVETTSGALSLLFATFYLADEPFFAPNASLKLFDPANSEPITFNLVHKNGTKLSMRITNSDTATRRVLIHLVYEA